jgi:hypothetical protein
MDTIITFCRLSNMLCGVVEGSMTCDDVLGAIVFDGNAVVGKRHKVLHRIGKSKRNCDVSYICRS